MVGIARTRVTVSGLTDPVLVFGYDADPGWTGIVLISGRWFTTPDEVVAASYLLRATGRSVGDTRTLSTDAGRRDVRVVDEAFDPRANGLALSAVTATLSGLDDHVQPHRFEIGLTPGTDPDAYVRALNPSLGLDAFAQVRREQSTQQTFTILLGMVATLTLLLATVAALGVFNTVVLDTRERVHEIGVLTSIGMTPRQVRVMVVASMSLIGLVAGVLAVPLGYLLHHAIVPVMADAAATRIPAGVRDVYRPAELVALAVLGALVPAGWAARPRPARALRAG